MPTGASQERNPPSLVNPGQFIVKDYALTGDWFGTVRARLGYAVGATLLYACGGLAFGDGGTNLFIGGANGAICVGRFVLLHPLGLDRGRRRGDAHRRPIGR